MFRPLLLLTILSAALAQPLLGAGSGSSSSSNAQTKYIVVLKSNVAKGSLDKHLTWVDNMRRRRGKSSNSKYIKRVWSDSFFKGYTGDFDQQDIDDIKNNDTVALVEPVKIVNITQSGLLTQLAAPWGLASLSHRLLGSSDYVYDTSAGKNTWAYVIDTGVKVEHSDFNGNAFFGYNAVANTQNVDNNGHGTHCAGIIASKTYGVAKNANIMAVKVFDGATSTTDILLDGLQWAITNITQTPGRAANSVISMSLASSKSDAVNAVVDAASRLGILVVAAAGNRGQDASLYSPASAASALTVGAINWINTRASFSNYGSSVDIFAPGVGITSLGISSNTATATMSGTSMACPHVAGLALYLKALQGIAAPADVISKIQNLATKDAVLLPGQGSPNLLAYNGAA